MLYIPGVWFITLTDSVEAFYLYSAFYSSGTECGLRWNSSASPVLAACMPSR